MHFIILCLLIGAIVMIPSVRRLAGRGLVLFLVGFLVIAGILLIMLMLPNIR